MTMNHKNLFRLSMRFFVPLLLVGPIIIAGCGGPGADDAARIAPPRAEATEGPVRATAELSPASPRLSDRPVLTVTVDHKPDSSVELLPIGDELGDFRVVEISESLPSVEKGDDRIAYKIVLEPMKTGDLEIWPVELAFTNFAKGADSRRQTLAVGPLRVKVDSLVTAKSPKLAEVRPSVGPIELPFSYIVWFAATAGTVVIILIGVGFWKSYQARQKIKAQRPLTPRELAARELRELASSHLAERDVKLFYVGLTGVVRRFIERTTGIRAPEQTTEEFLREVSQRQTFESNENRRLKNFLEAADMVKFAAYRPLEGDVDSSIKKAKVFVGLGDEPDAIEETNETQAKEADRC
jgi:hypothetical protein